jgi:hypothetical protein
MNKSILYPITLAATLLIGCNNSEKQKEEAENMLYNQMVDSIKNSIDTLTWHEEYTYQGKGNESIDSLSINGPYRFAYVFQGSNNASFTVNREENGELTAPLLVLTSSKSDCTIKKDSLNNATLKIINNSGRWAISFSSLHYNSPLNKDSISASIYPKLRSVQDSLLNRRISALDTIQPAQTEHMKQGLLEWQFLANSNYIWNADPVFSLGTGKLRFVINLDIPEEKWYYDFMNKQGENGLIIELKNLSTGSKTTVYQYRGKCGHHSQTKEISISAGKYQIEYSGIGDIAFNVYNLQ